MKTAIYARVSTADQHNAIQIRELTEYVERRGWELAGTYQDTMSGAKANRPVAPAATAQKTTHTRICPSASANSLGSLDDSSVIYR